MQKSTDLSVLQSYELAIWKEEKHRSQGRYSSKFQKGCPCIPRRAFYTAALSSHLTYHLGGRVPQISGKTFLQVSSKWALASLEEFSTQQSSPVTWDYLTLRDFWKASHLTYYLGMQRTTVLK
ncbi:uncharacterized protein LOC115064564 isoform X2 [Mus pahari]|uniref:uncharacterized protein LOC115064564 isoform X2 n=1 Tax=Mus pahari TaxID=10093 RepID=UPI001114D174|nr:uncharacterized protein LOC115064564 isoform X2 [Mus pahari]XP_029397749.1 uncharacterized protein LOC115064564 isoform X2 [Mus pahari]XP_029397759.1 uncharacterized protein LOC115064564 isoform X2 [Mus pahari]XP_029397764.1 uncharacterized protein LOC115064564 isoform X2 [Mus pahari]XP_029397771.1 uncharacterized protein LOC115064564 isoform X2 [Mus pahari]